MVVGETLGSYMAKLRSLSGGTDDTLHRGHTEHLLGTLAGCMGELGMVEK
jgi:hypothetical protein